MAPDPVRCGEQRLGRDQPVLWHLLTTNSERGDPATSTAEKGQGLTEVVVDRLASFLVELDASPLDERFPF